MKDGQVGVCSRNLELKLEDENNAYVRTATNSGLINALQRYSEAGAPFGDIAVQGELMGPGVQGNREGLNELRIFVFDIWSIQEQEYFMPARRMALFNELCTTYEADIDHVPILAVFRPIHETSVDELIGLADMTPSLNHKQAEGLVFKPHAHDLQSFKVISNKFLLKEKD